jgi:hypothetical protein
LAIWALLIVALGVLLLVVLVKLATAEPGTAQQ